MSKQEPPCQSRYFSNHKQQALEKFLRIQSKLKYPRGLRITYYLPPRRIVVTAAAAKLLQSCPTLCDPIDGSPLGSAVPGILQARILEWVAIPFSNAWKWKVRVKLLSHVRLFTTPWTAAYQAPPSMGFSRQEYWSWVPLPSLCEFWVLKKSYVTLITTLSIFLLCFLVSYQFWGMYNSTLLFVRIAFTNTMSSLRW